MISFIIESDSQQVELVLGIGRCPLDVHLDRVEHHECFLWVLVTYFLDIIQPVKGCMVSTRGQNHSQKHIDICSKVLLHYLRL